MNDIDGYIFNIGDICVIKGCSHEYQRDNKIKIKYRKTSTHKGFYSDTREFFEIHYNLYSDNGLGWYPENTIELYIK